MQRLPLTFEQLIKKYGLIMTPGELSEVLGLSTDTVLRMLQRKEISARKAGSRWIIATESVINYLAAGNSEEKIINVKPNKRRLIE